MMKNRYFDTDEIVYRLVRDFYKHNNIIIAVDFDATLYDFKKRGYCQSVVDLMQKLAPKYFIAPLKKVDSRFTIILFTAREGSALKEAEEYVDGLNIRVDYVNESPVMPNNRKPFYNILLDDKAGLGQAYEVLQKFLKIIDY